MNIERHVHKVLNIGKFIGAIFLGWVVSSFGNDHDDSLLMSVADVTPAPVAHADLGFTGDDQPSDVGGGTSDSSGGGSSDSSGGSSDSSDSGDSGDSGDGGGGDGGSSSSGSSY